MADSTITINDFADLLEQEDLPQETLQTLLIVLSEISLKADRFEANTGELLALAREHSPTFQQPPADRREFFSSVLCMPVFFYTVPLSDDEAKEWEKLNDKEALAWERKPDL
ncbi:hypothetical protein [Enterobacter cloacae]|uniref:hypothetical protein n=1 Tax=Enterobacter cloacae TaxID=550 RepID=UPI002FF767F0